MLEETACAQSLRRAQQWVLVGVAAATRLVHAVRVAKMGLLDASVRLLWQPRLERVLAIHAALLAMVLVVLFEHWQRVRRDDVHRAAGVREGRALGRGLDVAEHDALLGHARVVERVGTAVVVAEQNLCATHARRRRRVGNDQDQSVGKI
eukprot:6213123-Pleurochrysis_carterae.AAC.3